jgi:hypothetical protein
MLAHARMRSTGLGQMLPTTVFQVAIRPAAPHPILAGSLARTSPIAAVVVLSLKRRQCAHCGRDIWSSPAFHHKLLLEIGGEIKCETTAAICHESRFGGYRLGIQ